MSKINLLRKISSGLKIVPLLLLLAACGSTGNAAKKNSKKAPDWVLSGTSSAYPKSAYLTGIGESKDKKSAELDAIEELVSVFGQKVTSASLASRRMVQAQSKGVVASSDVASLDQGILREVNQNDIIAIEIPEFFESQKDGKWYALAVMSREKGTQIYSNMIEKNETEIQKLLNQVKSDKDPYTLQNFARLDFAEEVAGLNEGYLKRLTIINPSAGEKFASISTPVQIHKTKYELAVKIPVCVSVDSDSDGRIAKAFQEVMSSFGFNTTLGSNERYKISCQNHFTPGESGDGKTKFCEYAAECALIDTFSGETLVPLSVTGREGSQTAQNAEIRAKQKISSKIKGDFANGFQKYLGDFTD